MRTNALVTMISSVAAMIGLSTMASAQQEMAIRTEGVQPYSVELKPIPTILSAAPGVASIGAGFESFFMPKVAFFGEASYLDAKLQGKVVGTAKDRNTDPVPSKEIGYKGLLGARWYATPEEHSWYAGGGVGYSDSSGKWEYKNEVVDSRLVSVLPTVQGGYRWLWNNNVLLRLGADVALNNIQTRTNDAHSDSIDAKDAEAKLKKIQDHVWLATVDLGLGYAF